MTEPQNAPEKLNTDEEKMAQDFNEKINYIRQWLDCAPDFPVLFQVLLLKIIVDRNNETPAPEEIARVQQWIESFYKDLSAIMGTLESHITLSFLPDVAMRTPIAKLTPTGEEWMRQHISPPPETETKEAEA